MLTRSAVTRRVTIAVALVLVLSSCTALPWNRADPEPIRDGGAERLLALIELLVVADEAPRRGYSRDHFEHWVDINGSGCRTRYDVLIAQAVGPVQRDPTRWCAIVEGDWYSEFDGETYSGAPAEIDVDHVVALAEAWDSGAHAWSHQRRRQFANDPLNLLVVTRRSNQDKADLDVGEWRPERSDAWCITAAMTVLTKLRYALDVDPGERRGLERLALSCDRDDQRTTGGFPLPGTAAFDTLAESVLDERSR